MKNIYLIPTPNPSRFTFRKDYKYYRFRKDEFANNDTYQNQNIYITNDEEIKDGWSYDRMMKSVNKTDNVYSSKIILTTDEDLIKDGIQAIPDEFLEWFVKNPSCEEVNVESKLTVKENGIQELMKDKYYQQFPEELPNCVFINHYKIIIPKEEPKQETIEEAAERIQKTNSVYETGQDDFYQGFIACSKWQQEKIYSEEDMRKAFSAYSTRAVLLEGYNSFDEFIEQFKK
jgi:hypothetical protein